MDLHSGATDTVGLSGFFSASQARADRWRAMNAAAKRLAAATGSQAEVLRCLALDQYAALAPVEDYCGYPGPRLLSLVRQRLEDGDGAGFARLVQRISAAMMSNSYRDDAEAWRPDEDAEAHLADILPPTLGSHGGVRRPYFEVLVVTPSDRSTWGELAQAFRRLRRDQDSFTYEPVVVGSLEDALLAAVVNSNLQAVVIWDGFGLASRHDVPDLRRILEPHLPVGGFGDEGDLGTLLARALRRYRPELDVYLASDGDVGTLAGSDAASCVRRIFYGMEEALEIHLSILEGVEERYTTPYFDNLRK